MLSQWLRREDPPWRAELFAFIIKSRLPGTLALAAAILLTVDVGPALPWLLAFLIALTLANVHSFGRASTGKALSERMGFIEMVGPILLGFWLPELLFPALLMSVMSAVLARLLYGPRVTILGILAVVGLASFANYLHPVPYAGVAIAVYFVTCIRLVAGLDVLARREMSLAHRLRERAERDALTGLASRTFFVESLQRRLRDHADSAHPVGLLFVDVDRFKEVNDNHGHHAGDLLLIEIARRMTEAAPGALVGRIGGDEFAILVEEEFDGRSDAVVRGVHDRLAEPIEVGDSDVVAKVSIGLAIGPRDGSTVVDLFKSADVAMYVVKSATRAPDDPEPGRGHGQRRYRDSGSAAAPIDN